MKTPFKKYMAQALLGKTLHFTCDCLMSLDVYGTIVDYVLSGSEIVFSVQTETGKIIKIGENHPSLQVDI